MTTATFDQALGYLRQALDDAMATFHAGQWEAIETLVQQRARLLVVERTGWGKSMVYFLATRLLRDAGAGPTLIISPLLALMRNQVEAAERLGLRAVRVDSTNSADWPETFAALQYNQVDALLISPERLANDDFRREVVEPVAHRLGLMVVDEAHCISDWGHDFRPDYRRLARILRRMPQGLPILATTATANNRVIADVSAQLGEVRIQRGPLVRKSLHLRAAELPTAAERLAWLAHYLPQWPGTGIVYTLTKHDAEQVSAWLRQQGIEAWPYYSDAVGAGFTDTVSYRAEMERRLRENEIKALVATSALGMGYDKPDLAFVIHYQLPNSIISYYQQVGRAGRAIPTAAGVLLAGEEDGAIHRYFRDSALPSEAEIGEVLTALETSDGLSRRELEQQTNLRAGRIALTLKFLEVEEPSPLLRDGRQWRRLPIRYQPDRQHLAQLNQQREQEWEQMVAYVQSDECRMQVLARALDDPSAEPCGKCDNCRGIPLRQEVPNALRDAAARFLRQSERPIPPKAQVAANAFAQYGFKGTLPMALRAEEGRVLARWGEPGWGQMVAEDKHTGHFRDTLIEATIEMIEQRWRPDPAPTWVTCVPSQRHPMLVTSLAQRLATRIGLPFHGVVHKVLDNLPQKGRHNRFQQCRNLDGAFRIEEALPPGPVLLVDDIVDSGWTLTVVAALLRRAGSGIVWPLALATTSHSDEG